MSGASPHGPGFRCTPPGYDAGLASLAATLRDPRRSRVFVSPDIERAARSAARRGSARRIASNRPQVRQIASFLAKLYEAAAPVRSDASPSNPTAYPSCVACFPRTATQIRRFVPLVRRLRRRWRWRHATCCTTTVMHREMQTGPGLQSVTDNKPTNSNLRGGPCYQPRFPANESRQHSPTTRSQRDACRAHDASRAASR